MLYFGSIDNRISSSDQPVLKDLNFEWYFIDLKQTDKSCYFAKKSLFCLSMVVEILITDVPTKYQHTLLRDVCLYDLPRYSEAWKITLLIRRRWIRESLFEPSRWSTFKFDDCTQACHVVHTGGIHKPRWQDEVGRWYLKCQWYADLPLKH